MNGVGTWEWRVLCVEMCAPGLVGVCVASKLGVVMVEAGRGGDFRVLWGRSVGVRSVVVCVGGSLRSGVVKAVVVAGIRVGE